MEAEGAEGEGQWGSVVAQESTCVKGLGERGPEHGASGQDETWKVVKSLMVGPQSHFEWRLWSLPQEQRVGLME